MLSIAGGTWRPFEVSPNVAMTAESPQPAPSSRHAPLVSPVSIVSPVPLVPPSVPLVPPPSVSLQVRESH